MAVFDRLQSLVGTFRRDLQLARELESANPEDNLAIKASVVGFSYNSPTQDWAKAHFEFVSSRLERDYCPEELAEYGENGENVRLFFALCIGYLLGLYHRGEIDDAEFKLAEIQIPGIIMSHLGTLTERPVK